MTPAAIVATAAREGLSVIAITDHNEIENVASTLEAARSTGMLVVAGVELSTSQGHLLCYLPSLDELRRFHGQLSIVDRNSPNSRCRQSIFECLELLSRFGGFGILAHVDIASGFEVENPGASPHKVDVICHGALLGMELKHAASPISYAVGDPDPERARMGRERIERLKLGSRQFLARVLNSDAHALAALGRNAANLQRVTRYKLDTPSFSALRLALEDADARVRIEDQIPEDIPQIVGLHADGGFLSGQIVQFSANLNCIIGGRGTGKSTTFEAVRCIAGDTSESKVVDSEVWPDELRLLWKDRAGQLHTLYRQKDGELQNLDDPDFGPTAFEIDCFGQGEAARISQRAQTDPGALLSYLDRFVDLKTAEATEEAARELLLTLQSDIEKAEQQVKLIPQYERLLNTTRQQLAALQKPEVKELIELQRQLAAEQELRSQISEKVRETKEEAQLGASRASVAELRKLADPAQMKVGSSEFSAIVAGADSLQQTLATAETQVKDAIAAFDKLVSTQVSSWKAKEAEAQKRIDAKRRELEALNVRFDMSYIAKLAKDEASYQQSVKNLGSSGFSGG